MTVAERKDGDDKVIKPSLFLGMNFLVSFVAAGIALALLLSNSTDSYPRFLLSFCAAVAEVVPSIKGFIDVSTYPVVTQIFLSIEWALSPFLAFVIFRQPKLMTPNRRTLTTWPKWKIVAALMIVSGVVIIYPVFVQVSAEDLLHGMLHEWALRKVSTSRFWLGLIGSCVIFCIAYWMALVVAYFRALVSGR